MMQIAKIYANSSEVQRPLTVRVKVVEELTGFGRSKIYELMKAGRLESVKVGRSRLIVFASLVRLVSPDCGVTS